jgi:hypothetical protein
MSLMGTAPLMTKEHPRIDEFLDELAGSQGLNLRTHCGLEAAHFGRCDGRNARPLVKRILSRMGFSAAEIKQSMLYFDSSKLNCDCSVFLDILNVDGAFESQMSEYRRVLDTARAGAFSV